MSRLIFLALFAAATRCTARDVRDIPTTDGAELPPLERALTPQIPSDEVCWSGFPLWQAWRVFDEIVVTVSSAYLETGAIELSWVAHDGGAFEAIGLVDRDVAAPATLMRWLPYFYCSRQSGEYACARSLSPFGRHCVNVSRAHHDPMSFGGLVEGFGQLDAGSGATMHYRVSYAVRSAARRAPRRAAVVVYAPEIVVVVRYRAKRVPRRHASHGRHHRAAHR